MRCPSCGFDNPAGMKFCGQCATPLTGPCPTCGVANPPGFAFCGQCATPLIATPSMAAPSPQAYTPAHLAEKILTSRAALEGERKQVTVLFADLKGSMELLADRDPEEARQLLDPVLERMMDAVHRYEGTVNQVMGDGIMALFGAPIAHEDHAVRACYAALAMQGTVKEYAAEVQRTRGVRIHIRVGLNAGEVVVRSIGSDLHMDYTAVGQTTHLAARIDRLPAEEKRVLQTAAVIGTEVPFALLQAVAESLEDALHRGVTHLQAAECLYETRLYPGREYTFKHALTHEVAYGSLLTLRQGDLPRALPLLERAVGLCQDADLPSYFPWMAAALGAAYTLGGRVADAVPLLTRAIDQTMAADMVGHQVLCGLSLEEAQLLAGLLEKAHALAKHTLALAWKHQERGHQAYALRLLGDIAARREPPESDQAGEYYRQDLTLTDELGMRPLVAHCHHGLGTLYATSGQREQACSELSTAIALYRAMDMTFWLPQAEAALAQVDIP